MSTGKSWRVGGVVTILALGCSPAWAVSFTEDFESGLTDWTYSTYVTADTSPPGNGIAVLGDTNDQNYLYRPLPLGTGTFTLEFDFLTSLSDDFMQYFSADEFIAQLAYRGSAGAIEVPPSNPMLSLIYQRPTATEFNSDPPLTDPGTTIYAGGSLVTASTAIENWQHYSVTFTATDGYTVLLFDLAGNNGIANDSWVRIDNIQIYDQVPPLTPIPEPASALLFGTGIVGCWLTRRSRRGKVAA